MSPVITRLKENLEKQEFKQIKVNVDGVYLYSRIQSGTAYVSTLFDYEHELRFTREQHINIVRQIKEQFASGNYSGIKYISLICTSYVDKVKDYVLNSNEQQWVIDTSSYRLFIYENQVSTFLNFRKEIEQILDEFSNGYSKYRNGTKESQNKNQSNRFQEDYNQGFYQNNSQKSEEYLHNAHLNQGQYRNNPFNNSGYHTNDPFQNSYYNHNQNHRRKITYFTLCNTIIIAINIAVYFMVEATGSSYDAEHLLNSGAMFWPYVTENHEYYRIITYMFLHGGLSHIVNNMIVLLVIGDNLERAIGKIKYILIYFGTGIIAGLVSMFYNMFAGSLAVAVGASGAIFGVVGAMVYIVIANKGRLEDLSTRQLVIFAAFSLYGGFTSQGVDNMAHIGGFISGMILALLLYRNPKRGRIKR
jgi:rhomboid protease GluP